ncbi:hypothetical protein CHS0354_008298 [Potamilus streckersoni]|uniref:Death domain-containing protein n=1 Tax=Potamilus streckersoni TaxID=2493646 RepID=A0AAE0VIG3_9BIVA|nr:hypothetical protein CHS0354_008298 [Potamilus streckersoni]
MAGIAGKDELFIKELQINEAILNRSPSEKELSRIARKVGKEYPLLGIDLGVPKAKIDQIEMENNFSTSNVIFQILLEWKRSHYKEATVLNLLKAMRENGCDLEGIPDIFTSV